MSENQDSNKQIRTDKQQNKAWKILLSERKISVYALAKRINAPYTTIVHALERDISVMSLGTAMAISQELGFTVEELVNLIRYK